MGVDALLRIEAPLIARKVKLKLNKKQVKGIRELSLASAKLYNVLLKINFELLDSGSPIPSAFDLIKLCAAKKIAPGIGTDVTMEICKRVFRNLKRWQESQRIKLKFWLHHGQNYRKPLKAYLAKARKKIWGLPRFKPTGRGISIEFPLRKTQQRQIRVFGKYTSISVPLVGTVKGFNDRQDLIGLVKKVSINIDTCGDFWATLVCNGQLPDPKIESRSTGIGVDLGLKHTVTAANEAETIQPERERFLEKQMKAIKHASNRARRNLPFIHRKIARRRKHSHHVMGKRLLEAASTVYVGNLNSQFLFSGKLARSASDAAHSQFLSILSYKAANAGKTMKIVNEAYTTQTCYSCKRRQKMELSEREYFCPCGYSNNRDVNAALNILFVGERQRLGA